MQRNQYSIKEDELLGPATPLNPPKMRACRRCSFPTHNYFMCPSCTVLVENGEELGAPLMFKRCSFEACDRAHFIKGLCSAHHLQKIRGTALRPIRYQAPARKRAA